MAIHARRAIRRMSSTLLCLGLALAVAPAQAGRPTELDDLQMVLDVFGAASDEVRLTLLAAGFQEVARSHGWEGSCADAFGAYASAPPEVRSEQITAAFPGCQALCPGGATRGEAMLRLPMVPPLRRTAALVEVCDASGSEPVFTGELAPLRDQMSMEGYWVFRAGFDLARQRLDAIGGERAAEMRVEYDALIPRVAEELSRHLPPPDLADRLPETSSRRSPSGATVLVIRSDGLFLDGVRVCELLGGVVPPEQLEGNRILPLSEALGQVVEQASDQWWRDEHRLLIQMDRDLSSRLLDGVLYTAGKARFSEFELAGLTHDEARQTVSHVCLPALSRYLGTTGDLDELPPLNLTVLLDGDGIRVAGSAAVLADADGEAPTILWATQADPFGELHSLLVQIKDEYPDDEDVILVTEGDVPYHRVMAALDASRERDSGREGYPDDLFPYAIYVGGIGVPAPVDLAGDPLLGGLLGTSGLGGLGTAGSSSDSSGYGSGGGAFGSGATGADTPGDPIILGALDKATIDAEIKSHLAQIRFCYQRELNKQPGLAGKLTVKFVIAADGTVSSGSTRSTTLNNVTVESCVLAVIRRMEFPPPDGGGIVIVSYPFVFKSGNGSAE